LRIISGTHKGRTINIPNNLPSRPTTDFAKEGLFNVLAKYVEFDEITSLLDLFAGTGNISYEFASRGALNILAVEMSGACIHCIKKEVENFGFTEIKLFQGDCFKFIKSCNNKFDFIFADPPFDLEKAGTLPEMIFEKQLLTAGGILVIEHQSQINFAGHPKLMEKRTYGKVNFSIFKNT
jgi:16S rRNA (guanine(966)-N(2))-methyltransferase RsmD